MKLKLAMGFFPYILMEKDLEGTTIGRAKMFLVWLDPKAGEGTDEHEEFHVAWWYCVTALVTILLSLLGWPVLLSLLWAISVDPLLGLIKPYKVYEESWAYAYGALHYEDKDLYIERLEHSQLHKDLYGDDFAEKVKKRLKWFK